MTKTILAVAASALIATGLMAGGDISPVVTTEAEAVVEDNSNFYLGLGYSYLNTDAKVFGFDNDRVKGSNDGVMIQAGYNFNEFIAIEGRYTYGTDSEYKAKYFGMEYAHRDLNVESFGIYVKPQYSVTDTIGVYGLLGMASLSYDYDSKISDLFSEDRFSDTEWSFAYGVGAKYSATETIDVFVDATSIYDIQIDGDDVDTYAINVGLSYNF